MGHDVSTLSAALADRYRIERELGSGGMATVYLARDLKHEREVAIKVLRSDLAASTGRERFAREITIAAGLAHPHILPVHDSGVAGDRFFYVMPYVDGPSLRERLARTGEFPITEAVRILHDVADAMVYAHRRGVVHRDLKPDNVLLTERHALVADFGVAKALTEATRDQGMTTAGVALGTPAYMSPEQATADPRVDHRSDIYAFGVLAYELLTGRLPLEGRSSQELLVAHVTATPAPVTTHRPSIPAPLAALVMKCLEKNPADRWQGAEEMLPVLAACATPSAGVAQTTVSAATRRRTARFAWGAAGVVAAVVLVVFVAWSRADTSTAPETPTIAVLPFENLGAAEDAYFAEGMSEEITSRLTRVSGLSVIGRSSALEYRGTRRALPEIGRELGVAYLLVGSVRWEKPPSGPTRVRISPQLIRVRDGTHIWAEPHEAQLAGVFQLQSDVAEQVVRTLVARVLKPQVAAIRRQPTANLDAYDLYLRGMQYFYRGNNQDWNAFLIALEHFQRAIALDSSFALAHARLSHIQLALRTYDQSVHSGVTWAQRNQWAMEAAERAVALDPGLPAAHWALASAAGALGDTATWRRELEAVARSGEESGEVLLAVGSLAAGQGQAKEAEAAYKRAVVLEPRDLISCMALASFLADARRVEEAQRELDRAIDIRPDNPRVYSVKAWLHLKVGDRQRALEALRRGAARVGMAELLVDMSKHSGYVKMIGIFQDELGAPMRRMPIDGWAADTADYLVAKAEASRSLPELHRAIWDSTVQWARPRVPAGPHTPGEMGAGRSIYRYFLIMGLAGMGLRDSAVAEARRVRVSPTGSLFQAEAFTMAGLQDEAVRQLELVVSRDPWSRPPRLLAMDPTWAPLRAHPRFQALLRVE